MEETEYNIEVEIYPDEDMMVISTPYGIYEYDISSEKGAILLTKIFGTNVKSTVYSQNEVRTLEEYDGQL